MSPSTLSVRQPVRELHLYKAVGGKTAVCLFCSNNSHIYMLNISFVFLCLFRRSFGFGLVFFFFLFTLQSQFLHQYLQTFINPHTHKIYAQGTFDVSVFFKLKCICVSILCAVACKVFCKLFQNLRIFCQYNGTLNAYVWLVHWAVTTQWATLFIAWIAQVLESLHHTSHNTLHLNTLSDWKPQLESKHFEQ